MRYFTYQLVALCIFASAFYAADRRREQTNSSEKQQAANQGTQNPEAYQLYLKGRSYFDKRTLADLETAISYFNQAIAKDPGYAMAYAGLAYSYGRLPDFGASARENIPKSNAAKASSAYGSAYRIAEAYAELGDKDQAFQWRNTAFQEHDEGLMALKTDFTLDSLRSDPRFAELVRKVGLPQ